MFSFNNKNLVVSYSCLTLLKEDAINKSLKLTFEEEKKNVTLKDRKFS